MKMRAVKERLKALRDEIGRHGGREWITIETPTGMTDDENASWLSVTLGSDWRRHVIVRLDVPKNAKPTLVGRKPMADMPGFSGVHFTEQDAAFL